MAVPNTPLSKRFSVAILIKSMPKVVLHEAEPVDDKHSKKDGWSVRKEYVMEDMVPPTLSKVRKDMLPREFNYLIHNGPHMEEVIIPQDEGGKEPITNVHSVVVVKVIPNILNCDLTVVIIGVVTSQNWGVESLIQISHQVSSILWPVVKHHDNEAKVNQAEHRDNSPESLAGVEHVHMIWPQVLK
jgi:hypothetical protein